MSERPNLADAVEVASSTHRDPQLAAPPAEKAEGSGREARPRPLSRTGTKQIAGHFPPEVAWQLRELAVQRRKTVQNLLAEALNDLFQKYGKTEIAPKA